MGSTAHEHEVLAIDVRARLVLVAVLVVLVVLVALGLLVQWPRDPLPDPAQSPFGSVGTASTFESATVRSIAIGSCAAQATGEPAPEGCRRVGLLVTSGPDKGGTVGIDVVPGVGVLPVTVDDHVRVARSVDPVDGHVDYVLDDFDRAMPLGWLALAFALVTVAVARWRGLAALLGLGVTVALVMTFVLPAVLLGANPFLVALTASGAILVVVVYGAHGISFRTTTALIGTLVALLLTAVLAAVAVKLTHLTGMSSEDLTAVQVFDPTISVGGLILCGVIIGSLGVLNDVTVTQASAVWELRAADPRASRRTLYLSAMRIGRDHIASSVYTLVLAYVGAALPILLLFSMAGRAASDVVVGDLVAGEIVRSLVGALGFIAAVPLTTALAALAVPGQGHGAVAELDVEHSPSRAGAPVMTPGVGSDEQPIASGGAEDARQGR